MLNGTPATALLSSGVEYDDDDDGDDGGDDYGENDGGDDYDDDKAELSLSPRAHLDRMKSKEGAVVDEECPTAPLRSPEIFS